MRHQILLVDQIIDRLLDVDIALDHTCLLKQDSAARIEERCGAPILLWVSSVCSLSCSSTTASGSSVTVMKSAFTSS